MELKLEENLCLLDMIEVDLILEGDLVLVLEEEIELLLGEEEVLEIEFSPWEELGLGEEGFKIIWGLYDWF